MKPRAARWSFMMVGLVACTASVTDRAGRKWRVVDDSFPCDWGGECLVRA